MEEWTTQNNWPSIRQFLDVPSDLTGRGVKIAIIDANFPSHPDISANETRNSFIVRIAHGATEPELIVADYTGPWKKGIHGLWAAAAAAGTGTLSDGLYTGMAPHAELYLISAYKTGVEDFALKESLEWVRDTGWKLGIQGLFVAFNTRPHHPLLPWQLEESMVLCEQLSELGMLVISVTGNSTDAASLCSQACAPSVLSVGGVVIPNVGGLADAYSYPCARGVTFEGKWIPEILAPAENLVLPWGDLEMLAAHPFKNFDNVPKGYARIDGTSFAGPIVLGAAACLWQAHPEWTNEQVKHALISGSFKNERWSDLRSGVVSVRASVSTCRPVLNNRSSPFSRWQGVCSIPEKKLSEYDADNAMNVIFSLDTPFSQRSLQLLSDAFVNTSPIVRSVALCKTAQEQYYLDAAYLTNALQDIDARVRSAALYHILHHPELWGTYIQAIIKRFEDKDLDVSLLAIQIAGMTKLSSFTSALVMGLRRDSLANLDIHFWGRIIALKEVTNHSFNPDPPFQIIDSDMEMHSQRRFNLSEQWENWLKSSSY
ncbi:S8 family serine peptidase [Paenibacillus eucommiae]|uniref:Serine protease AprX n=1 Tax=Paenibacillus eucommiae TaxID=1355755 RepID=A0ABS4IPR5_9BACL|nr:S8 family serine peptidase [Paenibacillus eucommiae]MBP1989510.1 serine protease AprX [Paenibacillus eucommiae]